MIVFPIGVSITSLSRLHLDSLVPALLRRNSHANEYDQHHHSCLPCCAPWEYRWRRCPGKLAVAAISKRLHLREEICFGQSRAPTPIFGIIYPNFYLCKISQFTDLFTQKFSLLGNPVVGEMFKNVFLTCMQRMTCKFSLLPFFVTSSLSRKYPHATWSSINNGIGFTAYFFFSLPF